MSERNNTPVIIGIVFVAVIAFVVGLNSKSQDTELIRETESTLNPRVEAAIRISLDKPVGLLTIQDFENVDKLDLFNAGIEDISFLSKLKNIRELNIGQNPIIDFSPLAQIHRAEYVWLGHYSTELSGKISVDLKFLTGLKKIKKLQVVGSKLSDLSPLVNLTDLYHLDLAFTTVENFRSLGKLKNLKELNLESNPSIESFTEVIPALTELTSLDLSCASCQKIESLGFLSGLTKLQTLNLEGNLVSDLTPLSALRDLKRLYLFNNRVDDLGALTNLVSLQDLRIGENPVQDFLPLSNFRNLKNVWISGATFPDQSVIDEIKKSLPLIAIGRIPEGKYHPE